MRRLLHLYPGEGRVRRAQVRAHRDWLAARSIELVLADDWVADEDRALYAAAIVLPPAEEVAAALAALHAAPELRALDGVLLQSEAALPCGSLFAAARGLPGPAPAAVLRCTGKHLTRAALAAADVPQPEFAVCRERGDARRFAAAHGFPLMVKPFASTMARHVARVDDASELDAAIERLAAALPRAVDVARFAAFARAARLDPGPEPTRHFLCESFVAGLPIECDGFAVGGVARTFGALEQVLTPPPHLYFEGYLLPADVDGATGRALRDAGERAVRAVGLDAAGFSVELRASGDGPRVIEVNGRLGEDHGLWPLFAQATGREPFELALEAALGETPSYGEARGEAGRPRYAVAYRCHFGEDEVVEPPRAATLAALAGPPALAAASCVEPGDRLHAPPHPETFPHLAWVLAADPDSSRAAFAKARARVATVEVGLRPIGAEDAVTAGRALALVRTVDELAAALAGGRPFLAAREPALLALVGHAYPGLVASDDSTALAALRTRVAQEPALAARLQRFATRLAASGWRPGRAMPAFAQFAEDALRGLALPAKSLPCRWFYDDVGSRLFEAIGATPEYYVTRAEDELLLRHAAAIAADAPRDVTVVELGSGSAAKTQHLLAALLERQRALRYVMIDISPAALAESAAQLRARFPALEVVAIEAEYGAGLAQLAVAAPGKKLVLWLGSNVGNFTREEAARFLAGVRTRLAPGDALLLGVDLRKEASRLEAAYDDAAGVTARFNRNLLARMNRELDGDFDLAAFRHRALWRAEEGRVEMQLESLRAQEATLDLLGARIRFAAGETIHTEDSWKYSVEEIDALAAAAGLRVARRWFDAAHLFSENLLQL